MKQFFEALPDDVRAKVARKIHEGYLDALQDPAAQELVDNLNRNTVREAREREAHKPQPAPLKAA